MVELFANSGDADQTPRSAASDLGLHCLPITLLGISKLHGLSKLSPEISMTTHFEKGVKILSVLSSVNSSSACKNSRQYTLVYILKVTAYKAASSKNVSSSMRQISYIQIILCMRNVYVQ